MKSAKRNSPAIATMMFMLANTFHYAMALIYTPIFTRLMPQSEYGVVTLYTSWSYILTAIFTMTIWNGAYVGFAHYKNDRKQFIVAAMLPAMAVSGFALLIFALMPQRIAGWLGMPAPLVLFMLLYIFVIPAYHFWSSSQRYYYRYKAIVAITVTNSVSALVLGVWGVQTFPQQSAIAKVVFGGLVELLIYAALMVILLVQGRGPVRWDCSEFALQIALPQVPASVAVNMLGQLDRVMVARYQGEAAAALYGIAGSISTAFYNGICIALNSTWSLFVIQCLEEDKIPKLRRLSRYIVGLTAICSLTFLLIIPEGVWVMGGDSYRSSQWCAPFLVLMYFLGFVSLLFTAVQTYYHDTKYLSVSSIFALLINLGANAFLIPRFGIIAASLTSLASQCVSTLCNWLFMRRVCRKQNKESDIYDMRAILAIVVVTLTAGTLIVLFCYDHIIVRYALLAGILLFLLVKHKLILSIVREL